MPPGEARAQFSRQEVGVRVGDDETTKAGSVEWGAQPALPAVDVLDLVEEVGGVPAATVRLEGLDLGMEDGVAEIGRESRVLEVHEEAAPPVPAVVHDELPQQRRHTAPG